MRARGWDVMLAVLTDSSGTSEEPARNGKRVPLRRTGMAHDVYGPIDTVFFDADMTRSEVRRSLIEHDGYPPNIVLD